MGDLLLISGQAAIDEHGGIVGAGDFDAQAEQVFRNLRRVLEAGGSSLDRVVKVTIFLTDMANFPEDRRAAREVVHAAVPGGHDRRGDLARAPRARDRDRGDRRRRLISASRRLEDVERDRGGDERERDVDDLRQLHVDARRAEAVGRRTREAVLRLEPVDHREQRGARSGRQVHRVVLGDSRRREPGASRLRRRRVGREARHPARRLPQAEPHRHDGLDLDAGAADLAVALREVDVAEREQRAGHVHRQQQRRAGDEPADVEVAAGLARRDRPQPRRGDRRRARTRAGRRRRARPRRGSAPRARVAPPSARATAPPRSRRRGHTPAPAMPGSSSERATAPSSSQRTRNGSVKTSARKPKPGMTAVDAERSASRTRAARPRARRPGSAPSTKTGPVSGCASPSVEPAAVRVRCSRRVRLARRARPASRA